MYCDLWTIGTWGHPSPPKTCRRLKWMVPYILILSNYTIILSFRPILSYTFSLFYRLILFYTLILSFRQILSYTLNLFYRLILSDSVTQYYSLILSYRLVLS